MTTLNKDSMMVSAAMTDAFGASVPTTEAGLEKESDQTGIYIASSVDYTLFLKNAAGNWVQYASIAGARKDITVPWGDNTAAFFKCDDADANLYVHRKTGNILYDSTPENTGDDQNTLLTSAGTAAQDAQNYTFPAADGTAGQVLVTDGSGALSFADQSGGASGTKVQVVTGNTSLDATNNGGTVIVEDFSADITIKLPSLSTVGDGYQVKFMIPINNLSDGELVIQSDAMGEKMKGLLTRMTGIGGDSDFDTNPKSWTASAENPGIDDEENTLTIIKLVAGSYINFYTDGSCWYVDGTVVSGPEGADNETSADFTKETF